MTNEFRDLDHLIGLAPVGDVPPPLLGVQGNLRQQPAAPSATLGSVATTRANRPARASRPTAARRPTVSARSGVTPVGVVRPPARTVGVDAATRPLQAAVSAHTAPRGAEPVTPVVTLLAWLLLILAAGNTYLLSRTGGWLGSGLPFSTVVDYSPTVTALMTWSGHPGWPTWLSAIGAVSLAMAATQTRALRQVGGVAGTTLFVSLLFCLVGVAGSLIALLLVAMATAIGIAVILAITVLFLVGTVVVLGVAASS